MLLLLSPSRFLFLVVVLVVAVLAKGALRNLGGDRSSSGHKGYCLAAMVDVLCAVLSGGNWGPTVDGFTTNDVNYGDATIRGGTTEEDQEEGQEEDQEEDPTAGNAVNGIGHFFGAMRIDGFRNVEAFKKTMDVWMKTFRKCPAIDPGCPVQIPGDPEKLQYDHRSKHGIPVKLTVCCDLKDIAVECGLAPPFDPIDPPKLAGVKRVVIDST